MQLEATRSTCHLWLAGASHRRSDRTSARQRCDVASTAAHRLAGGVALRVSIYSDGYLCLRRAGFSGVPRLLTKLHVRVADSIWLCRQPKETGVDSSGLCWILPGAGAGARR